MIKLKTDTWLFIILLECSISGSCVLKIHSTVQGGWVNIAAEKLNIISHIPIKMSLKNLIRNFLGDFSSGHSSGWPPGVFQDFHKFFPQNFHKFAKYSGKNQLNQPKQFTIL